MLFELIIKNKLLAKCILASLILFKSVSFIAMKKASNALRFEILASFTATQQAPPV